MIINDLIQGVVIKLRGRQDSVSLIPIWLRDSIIDLTESYPFEELAISAVTGNFVVGQSEYPLNYFLGSNDAKLTVTRILSWFRFFDSSGQGIRGQVVQGVTGSILKYRSIQVVEAMSTIQGLPFIWTQVGQLIVVGFNPDNPYACYVRYQKEHPFVEHNIGVSQIFMPRDWKEILEYAAAEKGCDYHGMNDVGMMYHQKLYGNPSKGDLGLIQPRASQQERQSGQNERQLQPQVRRY